MTKFFFFSNSDSLNVRILKLKMNPWSKIAWAKTKKLHIYNVNNVRISNSFTSTSEYNIRICKEKFT